MHFYVFGCGTYVFLPSEFYANKLVLCSELIIFIEYEDNGYCFIHHTQGNIIFHFTHAFFDEGLFFKYTDSHAKEHKLYNKLLDKISPETELLAPDPFRKDEPTPVPTPYTPIHLIQNNPPTCSSLLSLSYKSTSPSSTPGFKKPTVEIKKNVVVDSDVEIQSPSPQ